MNSFLNKTVFKINLDDFQDCGDEIAQRYLHALVAEGNGQFWRSFEEEVSESLKTSSSNIKKLLHDRIAFLSKTKKVL